MSVMRQCLVGMMCAAAFMAAAVDVAASPHQFIAWTNFDTFTVSTNAAGQVEWLSPRTAVRPADELIPTWNASAVDGGWLRLEVRAFHGATPTKFFSFGQWSGPSNRPVRASVKGQGDDDGDVDTDTLQLRRPAEAVQFRLNLGPATNAARVKLLAAVLTNTRLQVEPREPVRDAWGRTLNVPTISQMAYADGKAWCSPTTVTMLLQFWAKRVDRADLRADVPEVARGIHDKTWKGTGNWSFNMAYVGSLPGLCGTVTRFDDARELETWIAAGFPVGVSLCYDRLRGKGSGPNGHLMVCVGFDRNGDVMLNDPGTRWRMQQAWPRERFLNAWAHSRHTVYLVHPEDATLPPDPDGHWTAKP